MGPSSPSGPRISKPTPSSAGKEPADVVEPILGYGIVPNLGCFDHGGFLQALEPSTSKIGCNGCWAQTACFRPRTIARVGSDTRFQDPSLCYLGRCELVKLMVGKSSYSLFDSMSVEQVNDVLAAASRVIRPRGGASDWTLQKTYFLACVESIEDRLTLLPDPHFFSWTHGPWSKELRQLMDMASSVGDVELALVRSKYRTVTRVYKWPRDRTLPPMSNPEDADFLDEFVARTSKLKGEELTRLAKEAVPFKQTAPGHFIELESYLDSRKVAIHKLSNDESLSRILTARAR